MGSGGGGILGGTFGFCGEVRSMVSLRFDLINNV